MMSKVVGLLRLYTRNILVGVDQLLGAILGVGPKSDMDSFIS